MAIGIWRRLRHDRGRRGGQAQLRGARPGDLRRRVQRAKALLRLVYDNLVAQEGGRHDYRMTQQSVDQQLWKHLLASKPRLGRVLEAIERGDDTLYALSKTFGFSVTRALKELLELGMIEVVRREELRSKLVKKVYGLTDRGRRLAATT